MKVLIIITTEFVPYGGLTTVVLNYYRAIDKTGLAIDIASTNKAPENLAQELQRNGSQYYNLGARKNVLSYLKNLNKVLKNNYDVVHVNGNSATMLLELLPAKVKRVHTRIAHVHNTKTQHPVLQRMIYPFFRGSYNKAVAVSDDAGKWLYGDNYIVLNNAINVKKYAFSLQTREDVRNGLGFSSQTFIIGTIGKLNQQKNHRYLLEVFSKFKQSIEDCKLVIVGGGELEDELKKKADELMIGKDVIFTGMTDDASGYVQAFDFFVFPSRFEGLGLALIEAQASGLKCVISDRVPKEAVVTNQVKTISINDKADEWADYIIQNINYNRIANSQNAAESIKAHGYDISMEAGKLRELYLNCLERSNG